MFTIAYATLAVYAGAFLATVLLARYCTPARWWRNANARAALVLVGGTWGLAALALWWMELPTPAYAHALAFARAAVAPAALKPVSPALPVAGQRYRAYDDLNLRGAGGVNAQRMSVVPEGAIVTATGQHQGDWWQVRYQHGSSMDEGWASSLWLRRTDEAR